LVLFIWDTQLFAAYPNLLVQSRPSSLDLQLALSIGVLSPT